MKTSELQIPETAHELVRLILGNDIFDGNADIILKRHKLNELIEGLTHWGMNTGYDLALQHFSGEKR